MAAQTFKSAQMLGTPKAPSNSVGAVMAQVIAYALPEVPEVGDVYQLFALPKGAVVVGGYLATTDIDTGTETLDIDLGTAADPDAYVNSGVLTGDAITDFPFTNVANVRLITPANFTPLTAKTTVQALVNAVAAAGGTGTLVGVILYTTPGIATS